MNQLTFYSERNLRILGTPDAPLFVAKDVCDILGIKNTYQAIAQLDEDERFLVDAKTLRSSVCNTYTRISNQGMQVVTESGLYVLIFLSRKPEAKKFRKWVTSEVLPSIRKTGHYEAPRADLPPEIAELPAERRDYVVLWLGIAAEITSSANRFRTAKEIQDRHHKARGFNWRTVYRRVSAYIKADCNWRVFDRYHSLYKLHLYAPTPALPQ